VPALRNYGVIVRQQWHRFSLAQCQIGKEQVVVDDEQVSFLGSLMH
jgi:hypothetical protein